jgi:hypothetical protein
MNKDILVRKSAATALIADLDGKAIIGTSGDEEHRLNIQDIKLTVRPTKTGEELGIVVKQSDIDHPGGVYDTIKTILKGLDEFNGHTPRDLDEKNDYNPEKGTITIHYDLPNLEADSILHKLYERSQKENSLGKLINDGHPQDSWVTRAKTKMLSYIGM